MYDGAHMRTLVADARVAMCRRINRTFAFPPSTVVPFYALPHCLASHAAYRKHSLTCSVFFPFFSFFFFFFSPHFVPLTPPLYADVFYAYGEFMSQHSDVIRSVRFTMLMMRQGIGHGWMEKRIVIVSRSPSFPNF